MNYMLLDKWNSIFSEIKEYTLVPEPSVKFYVDAVLGCIKRNIPGVIVECGCWYAGASLAVCMAQRELFGKVVKPVYLLDKFLGFEDPCPKDGNYVLFHRDSLRMSQPITSSFSPQARTFFSQAAQKSALLTPESVEKLFEKYEFCTGRDFFVIPGWVRDTVPSLVSTLSFSGVALLRLDVDLYEATRQCFELEPRVANHGLVLIDDYYHFDGCATAVHEFLSHPENPYKLRPIPGQGVFFEKRKLTSFEFVSEWIYEENIL